jgi:hypothetical protein
MNKSRFLGIGINRYEDSPLNGCVPDIQLAYKVAKAKYGFTDSRLLVDKKATKKNITRTIKQNIAGLHKGDRFYIHFSSHGSYEPVRDPENSKELDDYNEGVVPYDYQEEGLLIDDELNELIMNMGPGIFLLVIADLCYSGTVLRGDFISLPNGNPHYRWKNKFMALPCHGQDCKDIDVLLDKKIDNPNKRKPSDYIVDTKNEQLDAILISGCGDRQTSADIFIPELQRYHGALTFNLFKYLSNNKWRLSYRDLIIGVNQLLENEEYEQISQLECKQELMHNNFLE